MNLKNFFTGRVIGLTKVFCCSTVHLKMVNKEHGVLEHTLSRVDFRSLIRFRKKALQRKRFFILCSQTLPGTSMRVYEILI